MFASFIFIVNRIAELTTLIPIIGMLAYFVNAYASNNQLTPYYILTLFIVSVLAAVWALATMLRMKSTRRSGLFVGFIDLCFVGAFIAGVYDLRGIASANCANVYGGFSSSGGVSTTPNSVTLSPLTIDYSPFGVNVNQTCAMLKASFAFGIMNCIFFAITALMAFLMHRHEDNVVVERTTYRSRSHGSRRGHSSHSHRRTSSSRRQPYFV